MTKRYYIVLLMWAFGPSTLPAQPAPSAHRYGGIGSDYAYDLARTADSCLYIAGFSCSQVSGDKSENPRGDYDYWLVKTNAEGKLLWEKTIGGEQSDLLRRVKIAPNGVVELAGSSLSAGGMGEKKSTGKGNWDFWLVKLAGDQQILADYSIGGTGADLLADIHILPDGCRILGGYSLSGIGADKTQSSRGGYDYWLVKIDSGGEVLWDRTYGGSGDDHLAAILPAADGCYFLVGFSTSGISGEKTKDSFGESDLWIIKTDSAGNMLWDVAFGGDKKEWATGALQLPDGCIAVFGYSESNTSGNKTAAQIGGRDFWVVKLDANGAKLWDKAYGSPADEELNDVEASCGGFRLFGTTHDGGGQGDCLLMEVDEDGALRWSQTFGGNREDIGTALLPDGDFTTITGITVSNDAGIAGPVRGLADYFTERRARPPGQECIGFQKIPLEPVWNLVSSFIQPANPDMFTLLAPIAGYIDLLKNDSGAVVRPSLGINQVGNWWSPKGYQVRANADTALYIMGTRVPPNTPMAIRAGWQIIAYWPAIPLPVQTALASIIGSVSIVKNNVGQVTVPAYGINDIANMEPGQGYWLKTNKSGTLIYPAALTGPPDSDFAQMKTAQATQHFILDATNTGNNATLIVPAIAVEGLIENGDEIGVFSPGGALCGAAVFGGQNLAITIWGDDAATPAITEYLAAGQTFVLRCWKAGTNEEFTPDFALESGAAVYQPNGFYVLSFVTGAPEAYELAEFNYFPNPAAGSLHLRFGLTTAARLRIELFSADGKALATLLDRRFSAGTYSFDFGLAEYAAGLHFLRVRTDSGSLAYPLVLEKK